MIRHLSTTPLVSRSDGKTFHLYLFAGPIEWLARNGEVSPDKAVANFVYRSETLEIDRSCVVLFDITLVQQTESNLRDAADQMAETLLAGRRLRGNLHYGRGKLDDLDFALLQQ